MECLRLFNSPPASIGDGDSKVHGTTSVFHEVEINHVDLDNFPLTLLFAQLDECGWNGLPKNHCGERYRKDYSVDVKAQG